MEFKQLDETHVKLSALGIGTWQLKKDSATLRTIKAGVAAGINFVDTAEFYNNEEFVGKAIKDSNVFIATKVWPTNFHYDDVIKACERSTRKLGVKQIDLYQLHFPNPSIPLTETMKAMEELVYRGKIRYIGVSNFSLDQLIEAQKAMKRYNITSNQVEYSLLVRGIEKDLLPFCSKAKITVIAYSPLAHGRLFSSIDSGSMKKLGALSKKYGKSLSQIALNWLTEKSRVIPIPKTDSKEHLLENLGALGWKLKKSDIDFIDKLFAESGVKSLNSSFGRLLSLYFKLRH